MQIAAIVFAVLGTAAIVVFFLRDRAREGVRPFEVTDKDKEQFHEMRRELGIRRGFGRLLGTFGGFLVVAGVCSPLYSDSSSRGDWHMMVVMIALGFLLVYVLCHSSDSQDEEKVAQRTGCTEPRDCVAATYQTPLARGR